MKIRDELADKVNKHFEKIGANTDDVFKYGFDACEARYLPIIEKLEGALKFYSLKSNYSLVDEGRNYSFEYKYYELNEITYGDEELGTKAQQALAELAEFKNKMNGSEL